MDNPILDAIRTRRSVRRFLPKPVPAELVEAALDAARWAPSGMNHQPWRFHIVQSAGVREALADCTAYGAVLRAAPLAVAVFLDCGSSYHREKDLQGIGACLQNLLLGAHAVGLGACWLGEILNRRADVEAILSAPEGLELMAVVAMGYPDPSSAHGDPDRLPLEALIVGRSS